MQAKAEYSDGVPRGKLFQIWELLVWRIGVKFSACSLCDLPPQSMKHKKVNLFLT